jgi:hypothetical protein
MTSSRKVYCDSAITEQIPRNVVRAAHGYYDKKGMLLTIREASSDGVVNAIKKGIATKK